MPVFTQAVLQMPDVLGEIFAACSPGTQDAATRVCIVWRRLTLGPVWGVVGNPLKLLNALSPLTSDHKVCIIQFMHAFSVSNIWSELILRQLIQSRPSFSAVHQTVWYTAVSTTYLKPVVSVSVPVDEREQTQ